MKYNDEYIKNYSVGFFMRFLKENNIYKTYIINSQSFGSLPIYELYDEIIHKNSSIEYIMYYSFGWCETNEGYDFWNNINGKWVILYSKTIKHILK